MRRSKEWNESKKSGLDVGRKQLFAGSEVTLGSLKLFWTGREGSQGRTNRIEKHWSESFPTSDPWFPDKTSNKTSKSENKCVNNSRDIRLESAAASSLRPFERYRISPGEDGQKTETTTGTGQISEEVSVYLLIADAGSMTTVAPLMPAS